MDETVEQIVTCLDDGKAVDIKVIDMRHLEEAAFQYFVICTGNSTTHVSGLANRLTDQMRDDYGVHHSGLVGMQNKQWVAVDYGHILVHIFLPETRTFYNLEEMWEETMTINDK